MEMIPLDKKEQIPITQNLKRFVSTSLIIKPWHQQDSE